MNRATTIALILASTLAATPPVNPGGPDQPQGPAAPAPPPVPMGVGPTSAPATNPALLAQAKAAFAQLQAGNVDRTTLDAQMDAALTDDKMSAVKAAIGPLGAPTSFVQMRSSSQGGYPYAVYLVTFANGTKVSFVFALDGQGKIAGMQLTPPQ